MGDRWAACQQGLEFRVEQVSTICLRTPQKIRKERRAIWGVVFLKMFFWVLKQIVD